MKKISDHSECLSQLRWILAEGDSIETWESLCTFLANVRLKKAEHQTLCDYLQAQLRSWSLEIPRTARKEWLIQKGTFSPTPLVRLCNTVSFHDLGVAPPKFSSLIQLDELKDIQVLDLAYTSSTLFGKEPPQRANGMTELRVADLRYTAVDDSDLDKMLQTDAFAKLERLYLQNTKITAAGIALLVESGILKTLRVLDLRYTRIGKKGGTLLSHAPDICNLRQLHIYEDDVSREGLHILGSSEHLKRNIRMICRARTGAGAC